MIMTTAIKKEYRVVWQREGSKRRTRRYSTLKFAERFVGMFGPEPWKAWGKKAGDHYCCKGYENECGCGGLTVKEQSDLRRAEMPKLEWIRIESRQIGEWEQP